MTTSDKAFPKLQYFPNHIVGSDITKMVMAFWNSHIIGGYAPSAPFLESSAKVFSIGSCFAEEITKSLVAHGIKAEHAFVAERWNTAFALRLFLARALRCVPYPDGFVVGEPHDTAPSAPEIGPADLFVLTFGLSLVWNRRSNGQIILKPPPFHTNAGLRKIQENYEMRQTTVAEN